MLQAYIECDPAECLSDPTWLSVMELAKTLFAKDFMYAPVKQIHVDFLE